MSVVATFKGATMRGEDGKFQSFLGLKWNEMTEALVQKAMFYGELEAKKCAEDLLKASKALAPVAKYHFQKLGSSIESARAVLGKRAKVSAASANVGHDINIQFRGKKGRYGKAIHAIKTSHGIETLERLPGGNLRDSGEVIEFESKRGKVGYYVSYDTRRTDDYSREKNFNYAYIQHENLAFKHSHGQAKFLEEPYNQMKAEFINRLGKSQQEAMKEATARK